MSGADEIKRLVNNPQEDQPTAQQQEFAKLLLGQFDYKFGKGDVVKGRPMRFESNGVSVDIGAKSLAFLPYKEVGNPPGTTPEEVLPLQEEMDFYILREESDDEYFVLSRKRVYQAQSWQKLEELMNADTVVDCTVASVVKGGILVEIHGLRGFVPSSHLRVRDSFESMVGKEIPLKILSLDQQNNNIILSHRKVVSEQLAEQRKDLFSHLEQGTVVEGEVVRLTDFGAFVDLGGVDGLLPLSQMSWRWVEHPSDVLSVGEKVKVEVIGIDHDKNRVSLSIKSQFEDPWNEVGKELAYGDKVEGTITRLKNFGAFVEIFPGVEALLPSRDLQDQENEQGRKFEANEKIEVYIVKFSPQERRISLSFRPPRPPRSRFNPDDSMGMDSPEEVHT